MSNTIANNLESIATKLSKYDTKLIVVTKTRSIDELRQVYDLNFKRFGENKVQEMVEKHELLPADIEWHLIGHLQTNKVKYIAPFVHLIHSVDSLKLLKEINTQALKNDRVINCLLQIYIATEDTKFGLSQEEALEILNSEEITELKNIKIVGLMGMASNTNDNAIISNEFKVLKQFFDQLKSSFNSNNVHFTELSMGMSGDYELAISMGSTLVRVGSAIFGERVYN